MPSIEVDRSNQGEDQVAGVGIVRFRPSSPAVEGSVCAGALSNHPGAAEVVAGGQVEVALELDAERADLKPVYE